MAGKTYTCECGTSFVAEPIMFGDREMLPNRKCEPCGAKGLAQAEHEKSKAEAQEQTDKWNAICPPLYRDTDPGRIDQRCVKVALTWTSSNTKGIGLIGNSGIGKTRALFLSLRKAFESGRTCEAVSHTKFSRIVQDAFSGDGPVRANAKAGQEKFRRVSVLLIDDLGKPPATERADSELEELIEHRTSHLLPILWTANGSSLWLQKRFGEDRGEPIVRRLTEFSEIVAI